MIRRDSNSEWVVALNKVINRQIDEVPAGWKTTEQISKDMAVSVNQASKCITKLKRAKMIEVKKFKIKTSGKHGLIKSVDHYKLITSSAKESRQKESASSKS